MELEVINDIKNSVVGRREIEFYIMQDDKTPSIDEVKKEICKKLNLSPDSTVIVNVAQSFGTRRSKAMAHNYPSADLLKKFEHAYLFERTAKKAKKAATKAAGGAAEAPKEEKKEAKKEEKKEAKVEEKK
ncbi:MAG: 30S ribosomal protein S24e [Candidatus Micrarchaeales archaeon]